MFEITTTHVQWLGSIVVIITIALMFLWTWRTVQWKFDPLNWIWRIDGYVGHCRCSRLVQNLKALDTFYAEKVQTANYAKMQMYRLTMDQVEEDAKHIMCGTTTVQKLFSRTLVRLGYRMSIYKEDDGDAIEFEIHAPLYSIHCKYG